MSRLQRIAEMARLEHYGKITPEQSAALAELRARAQQQGQTLSQFVSPMLTIGSAMVAEPVSGLAGIAGTVLPGEQGQGARWVQNTQDALTYQPKDEAGQRGVQAVGEFFQPVSNVMDRVTQTVGDAGYRIGGPALGAAAATIPTAVSELAGIGKPARAVNVMDNIADGARGAARADLPNMPEGRLLNTEPGSKLSYVETPDGRIQMYNPNRDQWRDVTDTPASANALAKDSEIQSYGGMEAYQSRLDEVADNRRSMAVEQRAEAQRQHSGEDYKMQHQAPTTADNPSATNLSEVFPDIYSGQAQRLYGTGAAYDSKAISVINKMNRQPSKPVTVYRAVPESVEDINPGDWVTTTREYAADHIGSDEGYKIISKRVMPGELANDGNSIHEFGWSPDSQ